VYSFYDRKRPGTRTSRMFRRMNAHLDGHEQDPLPL
jgi:hypothetical protein